MNDETTIVEPALGACARPRALGFAVHCYACVVLGAFIVSIYHPILTHEFLHWDDGTYVVANPYINHFDWAFVKWTLTTTYFSYWHPLTWLSHGLDYALWGMHAGRHLLSNMVLYFFVTLGVFLLTISLLAKTPNGAAGGLDSAQRRLAGFIAAAFFAVHPQHVEVVAWVSERKELLSTLFILASVLAYLEYGVRRARAWLLLCYLAFLLAVMSKPMAVTVPVVLMVLDIYPLQRVTLRNLERVWLLEKLPFFVTTLVISAVTIFAQADTGAIQSLPLAVRVLNAFNNSIFYLWHWIWPFNLSAFYPFPAHIVQPQLRAGIAVACFFAITAATVFAYRRQRPAWAVTWLVYLVLLSPVIGIIHSGPQAAAERYAHVTTIGFYVLFALGLVRIAQVSVSAGRYVSGFVVTLLVILAWTSHQQTAVWRNDLTLWQSVAERFLGQSATVHTNLGNALFKAGNPIRAEEQYLLAIAAPDGPNEAFENLRVVLQASGQREHAVALFTRLSERYGSSGVPLQILGELAQQKNDDAGAQAFFAAALARDPKLASSHYHLARLHLAKAHTALAIQSLSSAIHIAPDYVDALILLADIARAQSKPRDALALYAQSYRYAPTYRPAYRRFIASLRANGLHDQAAAVRLRASRLRGFKSW